MKIDEYKAENINQLEIYYSESGVRHSFRFKLSNYYGGNDITFDCDCFTEDKKRFTCIKYP